MALIHYIHWKATSGGEYIDISAPELDGEGQDQWTTALEEIEVDLYSVGIDTVTLETMPEKLRISMRQGETLTSIRGRVRAVLNKYPALAE